MDDLGLGALDYVYAPSSDVAGDARWFTETFSSYSPARSIDASGVRGS